MRADLAETIAVREEILGKLRGVLIERMRLRRAPAEIDADAPLFGAGFALDSLDAVELIVALDTLFGVVLEDNGLLRQQMRTLNTVVDLVLAYRRGHVGRR
ncbi:MAG TPA: acyl carrier protein [Kofleriaceae bacterium]|nr:acyl carrier protein [Kofleriaceae bacterium]